MTMTAEPGEPDAAALYRLMTWLSPAYPVGAYTYSHGLEMAVEGGKIRDAATAFQWLRDLIELGGGFSDAVLLAAAYDTVVEGNEAALLEAIELAAALAPTSELALETTAQGDAFMKITGDAWPSGAIVMLRAIWDGPVALPVAVGVAAAGHALPKTATLTCYYHAFAANLVSAIVRAVPLGQTDGQRIMVRIEADIHAAVDQAQQETLASFGTATLLSDIASMHHESQYTRLFRS